MFWAEGRALATVAFPQVTQVARAVIRRPLVLYRENKSAHQALAGASKTIGDACLSCSGAGDVMDVAAVNPEIVEFAIAHTAELGDRLTILAPIVESACYVHNNPLSWAFEAQLPVLGASVASMSSM
jgi:hypothetical protein